MRGTLSFEQIYEDRLFYTGYNYFEEEILIPHAKTLVAKRLRQTAIV